LLFSACGTREVLQTTLQALGLSGRLNTAFVERLNLTLRQSVAALIRRSWATMQETPQLLLHLEWWRGYYHFVRPHGSLREATDKCANEAVSGSHSTIDTRHRRWQLD